MKSKRIDKYVIYVDASGKFRWRKQAGNGQLIANPGQAYTRRWSAKRAAIRDRGSNTAEIIFE